MNDAMQILFLGVVVIFLLYIAARVVTRGIIRSIETMKERKDKNHGKED